MLDQQHDPERHHRDRQPGHEAGGARTPGPRVGEAPGGRRRAPDQILRHGPPASGVGPDGALPPRLAPCATRRAPYDALLLVSFGGPGGARGRGAVPARTSPAAAASPGAAGGGRRALLPLRRPQPDQRPEPRPASPRSRRTSRRTASTCPSTGATATGTPTSPTRCAQMRADGVTRAACLAHQRLLLLLAGAGSTARTSPTPSPRSPGRPAARPAAALLQPPGLRRADGRRDPRRARRAARGRPVSGAHLAFVTHSIPVAMNDASGPRRRRVRRPAPRRRGRDRRAGARGDRAPLPRRAGLLLALRAAAGPVARARRQRPPRALRRTATSRAWCVVPIGFVSDHMEVVYDLDTEAAGDRRGARAAVRAGGHGRASTRGSSRWSATWCSSGRRRARRVAASAAAGGLATRLGRAARPAAAPTRAGPGRRCAARTEPVTDARPTCADLLALAVADGARGGRPGRRRCGAERGRRRRHQVQPGRRGHRGRPGQRGADPRAAARAPAPTTASSARRATTSRAPPASAGWSTRSTAP